jgi:hypothetical protein
MWSPPINNVQVHIKHPMENINDITCSRKLLVLIYGSNEVCCQQQMIFPLLFYFSVFFLPDTGENTATGRTRGED